METKYIITSSPHITSSDSTRKIMLSVIVALLPAAIMGCVFFGFRAAIVILISVISAFLWEYLYNLILKKSQTAWDGSAALSGLLLAMSLPATVPLWLPVIGTFFAIIIVKQLFGGIGCNIFNPALTARVMLTASWPKEMTIWLKPFATDGVSLIADVDLSQIETTVTPLASMKSLNFSFNNLQDLFLGNIGGCIGETSVALLLIGAIYLFVKKIITWEIPTSFILSSALLFYIFPSTGTPIPYMLAQVLSGGLIISAFFMATDYSTSPVTRNGKLFFGLGCGILTFLLRRFSGFSESVSYAILIMNIFVYVLDKNTGPRRYGKGGAFYGTEKKDIQKNS